MFSEMKVLRASDPGYLGIDPSLVSTGIWYIAGDGQHYFRAIKPMKLRGPERLVFIWDQIAEFIDGREIAGVALEGYAYAARGRYFELGELGGVIRAELYRMGHAILEVPPQTLKKFTTGYGGAATGKAEMIEACYAETGIRPKYSDEADAWALARMAHCWVSGGDGYNPVQLRALSACRILGIRKRKRPLYRRRRLDREYR